MPTETLTAPCADHPVYAGHFPGCPIVPGAMLLDAVVHAVCAAQGLDETGWHLATVKFLSPVSPGTSLELRHDAAADGAIAFSLHAQARTVASGRLRQSGAPPRMPASEAVR